mmetsp:Transcript_32128/g.47460  ORF Transcript_32128/g.47460 Transcript_32128/m.47460 type:complete len:99 (+) Transcript_32128:1778-2074(+)
MGHIADCLWIRKEVRGQHRKPCHECGIDFVRGIDYVKECATGPFDAKKSFVGCMGRRLKIEVGTDLGNIQRSLAPLKQARPWGIIAGSSVQMFRPDRF